MHFITLSSGIWTMSSPLLQYDAAFWIENPEIAISKSFPFFFWTATEITLRRQDTKREYKQETKDKGSGLNELIPSYQNGEKKQDAQEKNT